MEQSNRGLRAPVTSQARVKYNATTDRTDIESRQMVMSLTETKPVEHPHMNLPNEMTDQQYLVFPSEILFIKAPQNTKTFGRNSSMNNDIRRPVSSTLNGIPGTIEEQRSLYVPAGVSEMQNQDNGSENFNAQVGGSLDVVNNDFFASQTGDYGMMHLPDAKEAKKMVATLGSKSANFTGRVVPIFRSFQPQDINFYSPEVIHATLSKFTTVDALLASKDFAARRAVAFLKCLRASQVLAAALELEVGAPAGRTIADIEPALKKAVENGWTNKDRLIAEHDAATVLLQKAIRGWAEIKRDVERNVFYRVLTGAKPGDRQQIHFTSYAM